MEKMSELELIKSLNTYVGLSPSFDNSILYLSDFNIIKMLPMIIILTYFWFKGNNKLIVRQNIIKGILGSFIAMFLARILAKTLPFRLRPFNDPDLHLITPDFMQLVYFEKLSSFPSDHATLGFALATTVLFIHFKWGIAAFLHVLILICLPRIYLSLHFPSDILCGAALGIGVTYATLKLEIFKPLIRTVLLINDKFPKSFYLFATALAVEFATMFSVLRAFVTWALSFFNIVM